MTNTSVTPLTFSFFCPTFALAQTNDKIRKIANSFTQALNFTPAVSEFIAIADIDQRTGSVEAGKEAALVLINGDSEKDPSTIHRLEIVFKDGVGYDSKKIFDSVKGK
jgi:hypothetical protein